MRVIAIPLYDRAALTLHNKRRRRAFCYDSRTVRIVCRVANFACQFGDLNFVSPVIETLQTGKERHQERKYLEIGDFDGLGGRADIIARDPQGLELLELGKHKVMSLRNIAITALYAYNGVFKSLEQITHVYNTRDTLGRVPDNRDARAGLTNSDSSLSDGVDAPS